MPSLGELVRGLWGPAPTPAGMPGEGIYEVKYTNRRTNVVRLLPNGYSSSNNVWTSGVRGTSTMGSIRVCLVLMLKP